MPRSGERSIADPCRRRRACEQQQRRLVHDHIRESGSELAALSIQNGVVFRRFGLESALLASSRSPSAVSSMADQVVVLLGSGPALPKQVLNPDVDGVDYLLVEAEVAASEGALLEYLCRCEQQPEMARFFVGKKQGECLAWMLLGTVSEAPPKVDDRIHIFRRTLQAAPEVVVVDELLHLFQKQLKDARKPVLVSSPLRVSPVLPLVKGYLTMDLGRYFSLEGREETMRMQIQATAHIFHDFMCSTITCPAVELRRSSALLMVVGFPGVGKTTMGSATTALLREFWDSKPEEVDRLLREVLQREELVLEFKAMVANSKVYNCRMYREIEATGDGWVLHEETGLAPEQLLALNTLYASLSSDEQVDAAVVRSYEHMLHLLSPAVKERITFDDVVRFIRAGLGIAPDNRIMLSFFFDEANKSKPLPGNSVSWFQEIMSRYVGWLRREEVHAGNTFVLMSAATTRFSVATLQGTASGNSHSFFIPLPPLTDKESERVVVQFLTRLRQTVNEVGCNELSEDMKQVISLSGGNPRMLSYLLRAFCTSSMEGNIKPEDLLAELRQGSIRKERMECLILNAWKQIRSSYYVDYMTPGKLRLILRAMQASLRGETVYRRDLVLPGFRDCWGDLESTGLVGLKTEIMQASQTAALIPVRVAFSTLILRYVFSLSRDNLSKLLPPLENSDWKVKEKSNLYTIMFMIVLHHEVHGRSTFRLGDVLPQDWFIPCELRQLEFVVPPFYPAESLLVKQAPQLKTPVEFWNFMDQNTCRWAFLGPQNWGTDSWLRLVCARTHREMLLLIESKCCGCPESVPVVSYDQILEKVDKDLESVLGNKRRRPTKKPKLPEEVFGLDQVAFLYMSDQDVAKALEEHKAEGESMAGVARRLIIAAEHPSESPFSKMSDIRHMMVFTPGDSISFEV